VILSRHEVLGLQLFNEKCKVLRDSEKMSDTDLEDKPRCVSCGTVFHGKYCAHCGEKKIETEEYSVKRFITRAFSEITDIDAKFYRSFMLLWRKPGFLTREYIIGRRKNYLKPIQMFLFANLIYFLVQPFTIYTGYNSTLNSQMHRQMYSKFLPIKEIVENKVQTLGVSFQEYQMLFNTKSSIYAKSLIFLMIPLLAIVLSLLFRRSKKYFVEHLVFSVHYFAWNLLFMGSIFLFFYQFLFLALKPVFIDMMNASQGNIFLPFIMEIFAEMPTEPFTFVFFYVAVGRLFQKGKGIRAFKSFLLIFLAFIITLIYRFMLFWITYFSI